jgi:signal transduction histidine kinase
MVREAQRAGRLVDELLLMARLDGADPAAALRREPVDLAELAGQVAAAQQLLGADVRAETEPALVEGDPEQLARVLTNLADNGRQAGGRVLIAVRRDGGQAVVEVTDDGPGVPPAERDRVFERFVRLAAGPGRNGLGLPIALAVARAHGGDLTCEDASAGARFVLRLPAEELVPAGNIG